MRAKKNVANQLRKAAKRKAKSPKGLRRKDLLNKMIPKGKRHGYRPNAS